MNGERGARWDDGLEGAALNIAGTGNSPLRVLAGPGTGKTYAMKRRVMRLLQENANPRRVLACTFTRTAARDIAREIVALGVEGADAVWAGTLHGLCFSILQRREALAATGRVARPLTSSEERFLLQDLQQFGGVREAGKKLLAFGSAWARLQTDEPGWPHDAGDRAFQSALLAWLTFHKAMLVSEMVTVTLDYLRNNPLCLERQQFDHVIVDEFQDLNRAEQVLIDLLAERSTLTVIGDEDQSIYSFKHAHPEGIVTFADGHPGTHDETLDLCRRCPTSVVELANHLIANNGSASGRLLQPRPENGPGRVHIVQWPSLFDEAEGVARYVAKRIAEDGVTAGQVLILAPRRQLGYAVRDALLSAEIVAHRFFNEEALDGNPLKADDCQAQEAYALLILLADPEDRVALRCWCGFGSGTLNATGWSRIRTHSEETGDSPRRVLEHLAAGELKINHTRLVVERFRLLLEQEAALREATGHELANRLFPEGHEWSEPLRAIVATAFTLDADFTVQELADEVRTGVTQKETPTDVDFVRVMSLHKSKGLTARLVVVMGCIEGMIPLIDFDLPAPEQRRSLEEQRRLFYVALTRTTETLILSSATYIALKLAYQMGTGSAGGVQTSQFITQLGPSRPTPIAGAQLLR